MTVGQRACAVAETEPSKTLSRWWYLPAASPRVCLHLTLVRTWCSRPVRQRASALSLHRRQRHPRLLRGSPFGRGQPILQRKHVLDGSGRAPPPSISH